MRPRRTISAVEKALSASFCAVPAFRRVEPAMTSGPTGSTTAWSARCAIGEPGTQTTAPVSAPASRAARSAPSVYGVLPQAETAITASAAIGASARSSAAPASASSSAASRTAPGGSDTPATSAMTALDHEKVGPHSVRVGGGHLPRRAGAA